MIYTLTLNPAIDYYLYIDRLSSGSILRSNGEKAVFGGKGINVSLVLKELGISSTATGFVAGFTGKAIDDGISCREIKTDFVYLKEGLSRINVKIRDNDETDINGIGPKVSKDDTNILLQHLQCIQCGDILVLSGSVPSGIPQSIYSQIICALSNKGIKFVVDAQKDLLTDTLKYKPFLIKPNQDELSEIFGTKIESIEQALFYAKELRNMGAQNVAVSMGEHGAILLDEYGKEHICRAVDGKVINTVGAGDSMVAGILCGFIQTRDFGYALRLGVACGTACAFSEGLPQKDDIDRLFELINK